MRESTSERFGTAPASMLASADREQSASAASWVLGSPSRNLRDRSFLPSGVVVVLVVVMENSEPPNDAPLRGKEVAGSSRRLRGPTAPGEWLRGTIATNIEEHGRDGHYLGTLSDLLDGRVRDRSPVYLPRPALLPEPVAVGEQVIQVVGNRTREVRSSMTGQHIPRLPARRDDEGRLREPIYLRDALSLHERVNQPAVLDQLAAFLELRGPEPAARRLLWDGMGTNAQKFVGSLHSAAAVDICDVPQDAIAMVRYNGVQPEHSTFSRREAEHRWRHARDKAADHVKLGRKRLATLGFWPWAFAIDPQEPRAPIDGNSARLIVAFQEWSNVEPSSVWSETRTDVHVRRMRLAQELRTLRQSSAR